MEKIEYKADMISLKDLLKVMSLVPSGGLAKAIIRQDGVIVNNEACFIPGKKLYKGDEVVFEDFTITII